MERAQLHTERSTPLGLLTNAGLAIIKLIAGMLAHAYALIADAVESTTDIFASLVVWRGLRVARRTPDSGHPFGYVEVRATLCNRIASPAAVVDHMKPAQRS